MVNKKQTATLENWKNIGRFLTGVVYNHPQLADGTKVATSKLIAFDGKKKTAETLTIHYSLGKEDKT